METTINKQSYSPAAIEARWQATWESQGAFRALNPGDPGFDPQQPKYYILDMFPYPSGAGLHVGHPLGYIGSDVVARRKRMEGFNVLHPMGFDAFGLPAEQYAIQTGKHPRETTAENVANYRRQLRMIGLSYDWQREFSTSDPAYYRWTQWIFGRLFDAGLAYQAEVPVWWCEELKTVLANEEVIDGRSERGDHPCERRPLKQWMLKITDYAERLLDDLDELDWPESVKAMQREWIGRSDGAEVAFGVDGADGVDGAGELRVFTTRPDTLYGATFMVLAPEHPLVRSITGAQQRESVEEYVRAAAKKSDLERTDLAKDKSGVFTGAYAINPVRDADDPAAKVPIWIADYVLMGYGTGAIMAVPAHDQRDFEFATKFGLEIRTVISPDGEIHPLESAYVEKGVMVNSDPFNGLEAIEGIRRVTEWLAQKELAEFKVNYRLRDWCLSRQRYWGPPIPMIYCETCGTLPVREKDLPVMLPEMENYQPDGSGDSPLKRVSEFYHTTCPECGEPAVRETDVSDNFLCSAWYFYRYPSTDFSDKAMDPDMTKKWLPVDLYTGGNEHAVLHLLYSRFLCMALHQIGLIDFEEPFKKFVAHGMIVRDGAKMSKSKGNVINPDEYIGLYGADAFRVYLMFMGDYLEGGDFREEGLKAMRGFLNRVWNTIQPGDLIQDAPTDPETLYWLHHTIKSVTGDIKRFSYNTAIARMM